MWDVPVSIYRTILVNLPDVVLHDKKEKTCLLIDTAIPDGSHFNTRQTEKLIKQKDLWIEGSRIWKSGDKYCASYNWSIKNN